MELEPVLLGLIIMHQGVTGYELNRIMRESTGYMVSAPLSQIYPSLKKLHERGLVTFKDLPIKNRLAKKVYHITPAGEDVFQGWLREPIEERTLDFKPFYLKMAFSPMMAKETILDHLDCEIDRLEQYHHEKERGIQVEVDYLDREKYDQSKAEILWSGMGQMMVKMYASQLAWLKEWRQIIDSKIG